MDRESDYYRGYLNGKRSPEYHSWGGMRSRCTNKNQSAYADYGGRGITICRRWQSWPQGFWNFLDDMGARPAGCTLERKNNRKGYSPGNCVWATKHQQANNKRNSTSVTFNGETRTLSEWAKSLNMPMRTLRSRLLDYGWSIDKAFTTPVEMITASYNGETRTLKEWADATGLVYKTLLKRYGKGDRGARLFRPARIRSG